MEPHARNVAVNSILYFDVFFFFYNSDWPFQPNMQIVPSFSTPSLYHGVEKEGTICIFR